MTQFKSLPISFLSAFLLAACISAPGDRSGDQTEEAAVANPAGPADLMIVPVEPAFDPCEEIQRQLAESRRAFSQLGVKGVAQKQARSLLALRKAETAADASLELAYQAANAHLEAQNEMRRVDAARSDEADTFSREVLELSGVGEMGSLAMRETGADSKWIAFTVLEDPATDVYYLENSEDPNSGERNRIALQETMFTEFPKYWDRTRETRDRLNFATLALASTMRVKREADENAKSVHEHIERNRERWYASYEASQRADTALQEILELEQSLERCGGGEGLASRIQRIGTRLELLGLRSEELTLEFDRTSEEVSVIAPTGYRQGTEEHLDAAWALLGEMKISLESARGSEYRALHAFAGERRDKAREHANRAQRACDQVEDGLIDLNKFFDRARIAAEEGQALYFQDAPETRARNVALSRMDLDGLLLKGLRVAIPAENHNELWEQFELWSSLPVWLSSFEQEGAQLMPQEAGEAAHDLLSYLQRVFRPCEPKAMHPALIPGMIAGGQARSEQDAYLMLSDLCGLIGRLNEMVANGSPQ